MKEFIEGSAAIARVVKLCRPGVIAAYPITPQTHIVDGQAKMVADGELNAEFVNVESEHSAASVVLGAAATGVRAFSATSSQGLILMSEVLFNIVGMRVPFVLTCANRSLSAPINIWNDHQDSITLRDSGMIQFYGENNQEVSDLHILGYRIGEDRRVSLPVMVCLDGYILTHCLEVVDIPGQKEVDDFLPSYQPVFKLDPSSPETLGVLSDPNYYMETRYAIQETEKEVLSIIPEMVDEFERVFGRRVGGLVEAYRLEDAEVALIAMGSVCGTIKDTIDELREKGEKVGLLRIITYRPFPEDVIYQNLKNIPKIVVLDKSISLGAKGPVWTEITSLFQEKEETPQISGFILGLGGRDITKDSIKKVIKETEKGKKSCQFIGIKP